MTFGGIIELNDKLGNVTLETDKIVNPFLYLWMSQVDFSAVLLQH